MMGVELCPPVTFQLRAGSGPVFLCGQECYGKCNLGQGLEWCGGSTEHRTENTLDTHT
jgi:hypothetical protein